MRGIVMLALGVAALACTGREGSTAQSPVTPETKPEAAAVVLPDESPGGEIVTGLAVPSLATLDAPDTASPPLAPARDRNDLIRTARTAFDEKRFDEATSTADVILLLFPGDLEAMELRGRALVVQGDREGGGQDLAECCRRGRATCCP